MTPKLLAHIEAQQARAVHLGGLFAVMAHLDNEDAEPGGQTTIIMLTLEIAGELNRALDRINLPRGRA